MWAEESVFYQIYPLGLCGAPFHNDGKLEHRILKVIDWIPHMRKLGINAIYFCPVFESDNHGYNTRDYKKIDVRLGTNEDFKKVCDELHANGIRVVLDGVFNHVGRGFTQFRDVLAHREQSWYKDWFNISFEGNSNYNDGLWYEGWEGNYDLVKLNLRNDAVVDHIFDAVRYWVEYFGIDGLRLDVAYCLDNDFVRRLRSFTDSLKEDFYLIGEMLHGDYNLKIGPGMLHSCTNYECYKGIHSSFNSMNMFEICHSLMRQFGSDPWCLYTGRHLLSFADNHDVDRLASVLEDQRDLPLTYALMFAMPGIPCIYYGSEWGVKGARTKFTDHQLRPEFKHPEWNSLTDYIARLCEMRRSYSVFTDGDYTQVWLQNRQIVFRRRNSKGQLTFGLNIDENDCDGYFNPEVENGIDLLQTKKIQFSQPVKLDGKTAYFWYTDWI